MAENSFMIDVENSYSEFHLIAVMYWPFDPEARKDYYVTVAAELLDQVEYGPAFDHALRQFTPLIDPELLRKSYASETEVMLYKPAGGRRRLANTRGTAAINKSADDEGGKFGAACGENLAYLLSISEHHGDLDASLNRARWVYEQRAASERRQIPGDNASKRMWKKWGPVAPIWAAFTYLLYQDPTGNLRKAANRRKVVTWALWISEFSEKFVPLRSGHGTLIDAGKAIRFLGDFAPEKPPIPRLTPEQLVWAHEHRAPKDIR